MNIVSWTPFTEMENLLGRYRNAGSGFGSGIGEGELPGKFDWRPVADISESKNEYLIKTELPEVDREDVQVSVDGGMVTIRGERKMDTDEEGSTQHRIESFYGTFSRSFSLPDNVDANQITAQSKNGVLKVHLPKTKEVEAKPIEISVS